MIRKTTLLITAIYALTFLSPIAKAVAPETDKKTTPSVVEIAPSADRLDPSSRSEKPIVFTHGDISWLPKLAAEAGWEPEHFKKLGQIVLRESGGCPNRAGGDIVDKNCNITGVSEWNHRSDSGLLQINGVHWKPDHKYYDGLVCKQMKVCTQEPLLDAVTNLKAGKLLFDKVGWSPWDTCSWNPKAKGCK